MYKWIDPHVHINDDPGLDLEKMFDAMINIVEENNQSAIGVLSIPSRGAENILQNLTALTFKALYNDDVYFYGSLEYYQYPNRPEGCDFGKQLDVLLEAGADGMKILETKPQVRKKIGGFPFTNPAYESFFKRLMRENIPVIWHVADPEKCWYRDQVTQFCIDQGWCYDDGTYPEKEEFYQEAFEILDKYPGMPVVFAHMFFLSADIERADHVLEKYPNVCFDLTPGSEMYANFSLKPDEWRDFFIKHSDRILFGTDKGWFIDKSIEQGIDADKDISDGIRTFLETSDECEVIGVSAKGLQLPKEVTEKIMYYNYMRLMGGKPPKRVNIEKVLAYSDNLIKQLQAGIEGINDASVYLKRISELKNVLTKLEGS